jgi:uncharacterized surface protein with fasciclin (FAS1) repeats
MKNISFILTIVVVFLLQSCDEKVLEAGFEDMERQTIFDYINENQEDYSKFLQILKVGQLDKTLSAYNPNGNDYTLFLPSNDAVDEFIKQNENFSSFEELIQDESFVHAMARYHVVNKSYLTNDFPFGALPELNLAKQSITIGFQMLGDSSVYIINNEAPVVDGNIEVSNGYVHIISKALTPTTLTTIEWLENNGGFTIFSAAVRETGYYDILNREIVLDTISENPITLFVEHDSIYHRNGIYSFADLADSISPDNNNYTEEDNPLNDFVGYHILEGALYLSDFEGETKNYITFGQYPVAVDGETELDIAINLGKEKFDTVVAGIGDTSIIQYITFYYDLSNVFTLSGAVHQVNQIMRPQKPSVANVSFEFYEEPLINMYNEKVGEYIIQDQSLLSYISWTGGIDEMIFVKEIPEDQLEEGVEAHPSWGENYIIVDGDFSLNYQVPRIVPGNYIFKIHAHAYNVDDQENAIIEVYFDGRKIGGMVDLTNSGSEDNPYEYITLSENLEIKEYTTHDVTFKSLVPGKFELDVVIFDKQQK